MKHIKIFEIAGSPDLIIAVKGDNLVNFEKLLPFSDVNCKDDMGWTPLLWATYVKNKKMIKKLIDAGSDMNIKALHHINGTKEMVDFYDLSVSKAVNWGKGYKKLSKWIEENYPEFVALKKYNL